MASIIKKPNGSIEIRYNDVNGNRKSIWPGKLSKRDAESVGQKIDHIVGRQLIGTDPDWHVAEWLASLSDKLYEKLVKHGLAVPRVDSQEAVESLQQAPTIKEWTDDYIRQHPGKESTLMLLEVSARSLCTYFGPDQRLSEFTCGDAENYRKWLQMKGNERKEFKTGLKPNTVRRRIGRAKQFFRAAVKNGLIDRNPFEDEVSTVTGNDERLFLVPAESIERCIEVTPCEDWRIILAFARYAGMRSHETRIQRWDHIDFSNRTMTVRSYKNSRIGVELVLRKCPIFPELMPHLMRAKKLAPDDAEYVQTRYSYNANILTTLEKIVSRAGLARWPKLMQNLRATRETELLAHYPEKDVTSWLGNSPTVASRHYAMTTQASFDRAAQEGASITGVTAAAETVPLKKTPQNPPPTVQDKGGNPETEKTVNSENPVNNWVCLAESLADLPLSSPDRTRTCDKVVNSHLLYQLSYRGLGGFPSPWAGFLAAATGKI